MCQTLLVCEPTSRTQTSVPLTKAKPLPKRNPTGDLTKLLIHSPKQHKSITLSELQGTLKTRRHQHEMWIPPSIPLSIPCRWILPSIRPVSSRSGSPAIRQWIPPVSRQSSLPVGFCLMSGFLLWDTQRDTRRDPLAGCSGRILGGIHWRATLAGYSAGSTGEPLWRDTWWDPLASRSGRILSGIHWRAALAGYSAGSTGELWRDTRRDPLVSCSDGILGWGVV